MLTQEQGFDRNSFEIGANSFEEIISEEELAKSFQEDLGGESLLAEDIVKDDLDEDDLDDEDLDEIDLDDDSDLGEDLEDEDDKS